MVSQVGGALSEGYQTMKTLLLIAAVAAAPGLAQQACPGFASCLYEPEPRFERTPAETLRFSYQDISGQERRMEISLRAPKGKAGKLPVVIWAHGGGEGVTVYGLSDQRLSNWSERGAEAGYLTVAPSFFQRTPEEQEGLCRYLGIPLEVNCGRFNALQWDRPYDIKAVLNKLEELNAAEGALRGRIDLERIGVAGHSAGSSGALSVAGLAREYDGKRYGPDYFADPRPKAFIGLSPSAPGAHSLWEAGFNDPTTSWDAITRPVLFATGAGDGFEQFPRGRRLGFDLSPPEDKYRFYLNHNGIGHGAFGDGMSDCDRTVGERECGAFQMVIQAAVFSFLDAYVAGKPQAMVYVKKGYIAELGNGLVEWSSK